MKIILNKFNITGLNQQLYLTISKIKSFVLINIILSFLNLLPTHFLTNLIIIRLFKLPLSMRIRVTRSE